ncbi:type II toxin-antitoxin system VapC family toxin [Moraxella sp. VT-16-12]|uniref:type II toxin-antitoxin system VapC family toxin n=1 Tax=Moraxella sp. VT-16-12 TaxID=2014877 RepID=UPI000B7F63E9|nr:type II toxin-antitoxin system VapC family toxin [Moraxella sp. VT-16-12]TWV83381.1 type II toxin-antitoxin system VapC family toxin [Moraxella sp. VT-16-12]
MTYQNNIYLDTHILVWLYQSKTSQLSKGVVEKLENINNQFLVSPMVILELEFLYEIGRINASAGQIFQHIKEVLELKICQKSWLDVVNLANQLKFTRDPFDRLIVANAMLNDNVLISKDNKISEFYKRCFW